MTPITLRWEWRAFGASFSAVEARLAVPLGPPRRSTETYLVAPVDTVNVKFRDDLIDLKHLEQVDAHGLQLWRPVLKSPFPLTPATVAALFDAWSIPCPAVSDTVASLAALISLLAEHAPAVTPVQVSKARRGATWRDCQCEVAELTIDGFPQHTLAFEGPDPVALWTIVSDLGLASLDNESYVRALRRFIAQPAAHGA